MISWIPQPPTEASHQLDCKENQLLTTLSIQLMATAAPLDWILIAWTKEHFYLNLLPLCQAEVSSDSLIHLSKLSAPIALKLVFEEQGRKSFA